MFAIIDIETTGGRTEGDRITEIAVLVHDGLSVVDRFVSLINPERRIPGFISQLTGITNEMVENAPRFFEVAKKIVELTEGCIFVAHNVNFDYGFVRQEFKSLGYDFKRETLCTVRLSRKLMPGKPSYSLGNLTASMGIEHNNHHRAEGDASATAILFDHLLRLKSQHPVYKGQNITELNTTRIDKIKQYILRKIPEDCGVYYFLDKEGNIIYIGKSTNMYNRAISHFNSKESKSRKMLNDLYNVDFVVTGSELIALLLEAGEIKAHKPRYNRMRKADEFTHCIDHFTDDDGILNLKVVPREESVSALQSFTSSAAAIERLNEWVDTATLCMSFTGLTSRDSVCFNHQIKKCDGICNGMETPEEYNRKVQGLIDKYVFERKDFVIVHRGRTDGEIALVAVKDGHYFGYGYMDNTADVRDPSELRSFIKPMKYYPDADELIRAWLRKSTAHRIVEVK